MMKYNFHTDHHIAIGHMHLSDGKPCQDHALSGVINAYEGMAYAVVSDGCSSGGETDIGARLVTTLTVKTVRESFLRGEQEDCSFREQAIAAAESLGLSERDLEATQIYAVVNGNGFGRVHVRGDGVVVFGYMSGALCVYRFEWANNAPFYPLYSFDALRKFYDFHGGSNACAFSSTSVFISPDGEVGEPVVNPVTVAQGVKGAYLSVDACDLSMIGLFTDGVCQVDHMEWLDTIRCLVAFKNRAGKFAKRRSIRFIKDALKAGHGPNDDLSMAVISITPAEVEKEPANASLDHRAEPLELAEQPLKVAEMVGVDRRST